MPALPSRRINIIEHGIIVELKRKTRKKSRAIFTWIRQRISPYCFGVKTKAGNPACCNRNAEVLDHFRRLREGSRGYLCRLDNAAMADHFAGRETYYFTADGRCSATDEVLVNIDCHRSGTLAGALAFAKHLRDVHFPGLYYESSTNGKGAHAYIVVVKRDLGDLGLNPLLKRLDRWLKADLARGDWDVENVEIKGHAPEFGWGRAKYELLTYKSGQLAKLPREAMGRADELRATTRVTIDELYRIKVPEATCGVVGEIQVPGPGADGVARRENVGSIAGKHFGEDELARLSGDYRSLADELLGAEKLVASNRKVVTAEDMAIFLMMLRFFSNHMNADGSLSTARWREMWTSLHNSGDVVRPWCHRRFAAMRNFLSEKGLLAWEEEGYLVGGTEGDGRYVPGKAARWHAGARLMSWMEAELATPAGRVDSHGEAEEAEEEVAHRVSLLHVDQEGRGESTLYGRTPSRTPSKSASTKGHLDSSPSLRFRYPPGRPRFLGFIRDRRGLAA